MPAHAGDQLGRHETAAGHAQIEPTEHARHQQGFEPLRGVFREQRGGVGHRSAQPKTGQQAQHQQLVDVAAIGGSKAENPEQEHRHHQHHLAAETVSQRAGTQRTEDHADQRGAHHRAEAGPVDAPFLAERRRDKTHRSGVQAIEKHDQKAQRNDPPLIPG